jgi:hypothetical protein
VLAERPLLSCGQGAVPSILFVHVNKDWRFDSNFILLIRYPGISPRASYVTRCMRSLETFAETMQYSTVPYDVMIVVGFSRGNILPWSLATR